MADNQSKPPLGECEFNALRAEILQRAQFQQQLINLSIVIAGTLLTVFFQFSGPSWILLTYPLLALFLAVEWSFNNTRIAQIGRYIREEIEDKWSGPGWENYLRSPNARTRLPWLSGVLFAFGTFVGLPLLLIFLAVLNRFTWSSLEILFLLLDSVISVIAIPIVVRSSER